MSVAGEEAVDRAQNFSGGLVGAARLRERLQQREANATDEETRAQFHEAIADLEARYPDLEEIGPGGAEAFARERGHGSRSRSPVHQGRHRPQPSAPPTRPRQQPKGKPSKPSKASRKGSARPSRGPAPTPRVDRAIQQTGLPSAAREGGSLVMAMIGATIGLSLLFLIFTSAERPGSGARAIPSIVNGFTRFIGRFISLQDFWGGPVSAAAPSTGASVIGPHRSSGGARKGPPGIQGPIGTGHTTPKSHAPAGIQGPVGT